MSQTQPLLQQLEPDLKSGLDFADTLSAPLVLQSRGHLGWVRAIRKSRRSGIVAGAARVLARIVN